MNGMVLGALILLVFLGHNSLATQVRDVDWWRMPPWRSGGTCISTHQWAAGTAWAGGVTTAFEGSAGVFTAECTLARQGSSTAPLSGCELSIATVFFRFIHCASSFSSMQPERRD